MVATRSTRASARLKQNEAVEPVEQVEETMEEKVENNVEEEKSPDCSECNDDSNKETTKDRINEVIESKEKDEVVEEAVKPDRTGYLKGFVKRVVMCTILVMAAKNAWPYLQSRFWPEEPVKVMNVSSQYLKEFSVQLDLFFIINMYNQATCPCYHQSKYLSQVLGRKGSCIS
jgi:hypothetical protein